ncbi:MAG: HNH endonuclease [Alicyclobacillus sp.]|nr:HNH endonuclease [Alicyclobacillus sp.]
MSGGKSIIREALDRINAEAACIMQNPYILRHEYEWVRAHPSDTLETTTYGRVRVIGIESDGIRVVPLKKNGQPMAGKMGAEKYLRILDERKLDDLVRRHQETMRSYEMNMRERQREERSKWHETAYRILATWEKQHGFIPKPERKPLRLSFKDPSMWRTEIEKRFLKSKAWKELRHAVLERDNYTCAYCGFDMGDSNVLHVNHVDDNHDNNEPNNLETICVWCHKILHSGLASMRGELWLFENSPYSQEDIIRITSQLRRKGHSDFYIIDYLQLTDVVPWQMSLEYLSNKVGFVRNATPFEYISEIIDGTFPKAILKT